MKLSTSGVILSALLWIPVWASGQSLQCFVPGACIQSDVVDESPSKTEDDCLSLCKGLDGCNWFTFYQDLEACVLLRNCNTLDDRPGCSSGQKECTRQCFVPGRCSGLLLDLVATTNEFDCLGECQDVAECDWFSFDTKDEACLLLESCDDLDSADTDFISGENECQSSPNYPVLISGLGYTTEDNITTSRSAEFELLDLRNSGITCQSIPPYPVATVGATSALIGNNLVVCGGFSSSRDNTDLCSLYSPDSMEWTDLGSMSVSRQDPAGVMLDSSRFWITGGFGPAGARLSTDILSEDGSIVSGPLLQYSRSQHCLVQFNATHTILTGGRDGDSSSQALIYDWVREQWTILDYMKVPRAEHACGKLIDSDGEVKIIVVGGFDTGALADAENTAEVYSLATNQWDFIDPPPVELHNVQAVEYDNNLLIVNGRNKEGAIYNAILSYSFERGWSFLDQSTKNGRYEHVATMLPESYCSQT